MKKGIDRVGETRPAIRQIRLALAELCPLGGTPDYVRLNNLASVVADAIDELEERRGESAAALASAARGLESNWDALCHCVDEFEPEDMGACAERRDDLDTASCEVIAALHGYTEG